jgi:sulfate adenylyltransferase subunit 2
MENKDKPALVSDMLQTQTVWTSQSIAELMFSRTTEANLKATERAIQVSSIRFEPLSDALLIDEHARPAKRLVLDQLLATARKKRKLILFAQMLETDEGLQFLVLNDARGGRRWIRLSENDERASSLHDALTSLCEFEQKEIVLIPSGPVVDPMRRLVKQHRGQRVVDQDAGSITIALEIYSHGHAEILRTANANQRPKKSHGMTHLDRLEAESMHIIREVMAEADNPVMLYSVGKDSSVMLHLARKAFYPSPPPFPLLHVDTRWKFQAMYDFRDYMARESGMDLLVHVNPEGVAKNINPFDHGSALHTDIMKTEALKQALDHYKFDVAFGGARRDEEKSRAKERVFSFRTSAHRWDPKNQRPELWNLYNGKKNRDESIRVFPISNWTELDIWQYIYREQIPIVPLYFAAERPVIERDGMLMMVDDDRLPLQPNEQIKLKKIRFRTLGCYPLTGAIESDADDLASIVLELLSARTSERQGRAIDTDSSASMEKKKQEGYF